ncbi:unnamed protein product [Caenorhabditis nigoni]
MKQVFSNFGNEESYCQVYQPRPRVLKGYARRSRPLKNDSASAAVDVVDAPVDAPAVEASAHHAACRICRDQELGKRNLLYNRLEALQPQQEDQGYAVGSRLEGKDGQAPLPQLPLSCEGSYELEKAWSNLYREEHQKWQEHKKTVFKEHLEQLRRGFIRNQDFAGDEMDDGEDVAIGRDEETGAKADEQQDVEKPAVKTEN